MQNLRNSSSKVPPHSIDVEESLLSSLLIDNAQFDHCEGVAPGDFYSIRHQCMYKAMARLRNKGIAVDLVTMCQQMVEDGNLDDCGGAAEMARIVDAAPFVDNAGEYCRMLLEMSLKRRALAFGQKVSDMSYSNLGTDMIVEYVQKEALAIQHGTRGDSIYKLCDLMPDHMKNIYTANTVDQERGYRLGFPRLDRVLNAIGPKLIVIAGRPAMGKTAFAVTAMRNLSRQGVSSGFLSIEMGKNEILNRWIAMETGINTMKYSQFRGLSEAEMQAVVNAGAEMQAWPVMIDDTGSIYIEDVERKCRKMKRDGAQVIFIDQLSKIRGRTGDQFRDYTVNCNRIADLKKELEMPIFLLAQINRELEKRVDKRPTMADLKNTGALEEDADAIILLFRPEYYINPKDDKSKQEKEELKDVAEINIAKNRNGSTFFEKLIRFDHGRSMFWQAGTGAGYVD